MMPALTSGSDNVATGLGALFANTTGRDDVATGTNALNRNTTGRDDIASGFKALLKNTTGDDNTALGDRALVANPTGDQNLALGSAAGAKLTTGSDNVDIANAGVAGESRTIRIGTTGTQRKTFLAGVSGTSLSGTAQPVVIKANGQLGTGSAASSGKSTKTASTDRKLSKLRAEVRRQRRGFKRLSGRSAGFGRGRGGWLSNEREDANHLPGRFLAPTSTRA